MSSSRSIAAARQRRGVESAPPIKNNGYASNSVGKDNFNNNNQTSRPNYRTTKSNIYQDNNATSSNVNNNANQVSKLSVSDAFALVTLRLGRVELIINKLQSEGILDANNNVNSENLGNNNNFDDTILQNIITRLDGLDKKTVSNDLNQKLQSQYNVLSEDVKQTKEMMMKLQSFIIDISQKLNSFITTQETINEEFFDLRDDFHSGVMNNDINNTIIENDTNQQIENNETLEYKNNTNEDVVDTTSENQINDQKVDNESSDNQNSANLDSLIANNLDNFTENTSMENVITSETSKNKQKTAKNKSMNVNV